VLLTGIHLMRSGEIEANLLTTQGRVGGIETARRATGFRRAE
jgi:hypothetical protein